MKKFIPMNKKIEFIIGDLYDIDSVQDSNYFCLEKDRSLLYQSYVRGDYSILLSGNWRFELIVDSSTGLCVKYQSFLDELKVSYKTLTLPKSEPRKIYVKTDEELCPGEGCHYQPFMDKAYWDKTNRILCIGNPEAIGEAIEFTPHIIMVIKDNQLRCIYLELGNIPGLDFL